jgi:hypothetical protein
MHPLKTLYITICGTHRTRLRPLAADRRQLQCLYHHRHARSRHRRHGWEALRLALIASPLLSAILAKLAAAAHGSTDVYGGSSGGVSKDVARVAILLRAALALAAARDEPLARGTNTHIHMCLYNAFMLISTCAHTCMRVPEGRCTGAELICGRTPVQGACLADHGAAPLPQTRGGAALML